MDIEPGTPTIVPSRPTARHTRLRWAARVTALGVVTAAVTVGVNGMVGTLLSVADPDLVPHRPPGQRHVLPAAAAAGAWPQRRQHRHRVQQRRLLGRTAEPADVERDLSNDAVTLGFSQLVNANDGLRTGAYNKTLTFTLSTTTP